MKLMIKRNLFFVLFICTMLLACGQNNTKSDILGVALDDNIKNEVEKNISSSQFGSMGSPIPIYNNKIFVDTYVNDRLSSSINGDKETVFKSFYYWNKNGDTLSIDGAYGLFGGTGFTIKIVNGKATLYHLLAGDEDPIFAYNEKDSLVYRLEVPCTDTKIILSEIPDSTKSQTVYGYVEFKSNNYYESPGYYDADELSQRKKLRDNMKIYFKSDRLRIK